MAKKNYTKKRRHHSRKRMQSKRMQKSNTKSKNIMRARHMQRNMGMRGGQSLRGGGGQGMMPFVGAPYNAADKIPAGNYLALSKVGLPSGFPNPPEPSNGLFKGGKKLKSRKNKHKHSKHKHSKHSKQRGGNFFTNIVPEDAVSIFRSVPAAAGHFMDRFNGLISSPSSLVYPTQQPLALKTINAGVTPSIRPADIKQIYGAANNSVK